MHFTTPHEKFCFDTAVEFTCVRGRGISRSVERFDSFEDAKAYAEQLGDGRTMIYAVNALGNSAHICNA